MIKKLLPITFSVLFIASCGGGGGGGGGSGGDSGPTTPTTPPPTINLSASPTSVLLDATSTLTWSSSNATSCSADWTSQTSTSGSEAVTITSAGNNSFSISCTGDGGSRSASVTVEGYRNTDGVVVDGYISGAEVFIDEDDDWLLDSNENSTTSDNDGKFTIKYANGNLVSIGGTDLDSQTLLDNLLITHKLTGHSDFKAVTPVTSIAAFMEDTSVVNAALGIDSSIDVFTFDPVANKGDGGIYDYLYEKGNQLTVLAFALQNITNNLNTTTETTQDYFKAITEEIEKEYTETETKVDIETEAFVTKVFDNVITAKSVTIDEAAKSNTVTALTGILPVIQVKSEDDLTTAVIRFAISTLQTDIQTIADGSASAETLKSYTEDLLNYIAEDQNIDSSKIAPDISAIADNVTTSEDTEVEINVLLNDSYVTSSPFSLSATNGNDGSTSISNNLITYSPDADYNGSDSFSYTITQGDKTSSADVTVTIEAVNDAPSIDIASTIQVEENQTAVTTVSVSDIDGDELTLTLGGTDAESFNLSSENVLTFKEAPDYETKSSYAITLSLTDGTETVTKDLSIAILDVNYVFSGKVIDGYIDGAEIFIDQNFNFVKDNDEFSATSDSNGAFNIDISDESLASCLQNRPIIADVPVGAIDSSLGEVLNAYQMILPSIKDSIDSNAAIYITPFTSLLGDAVIQGINSSNVVSEIPVSEGCGELANSIAVNISNELLQITNSIESSLDISFENLLIDFIQDNSSSIISESSAQKIAAFFPYFKELSDEFDTELSNIHEQVINTNVIIEEDAINSILSSSDIEEMPLSFNAIYETEPNDLGWFIQEKIIANGSKVTKDGQIKHYTCFTNSENCITNSRNLDALRNASKRYTRTSTFLNNNYDPENYNYQLVIEDEQRVDFDINGNPKDRVCIYQNWLYLTPVNTKENFITNDRYSTGASDGSNNNDDCSNVLANKNEALFVALVDKYDDGVDFEEIDIRITNPIYQNSTFFENKVNNIYQNRNNLDLDPLVQEIASVPRTFKDIENLRAKLTESSTDQISIFWTKRNASGQLLETAKIDIKFDKNNDYFEYGTHENSSTGSEYTIVSSTEGQQAINDVVDILYSNSNVFNSPDYLSYAPIFTSGSTFSVDENQTAIGTVTAVDGDDDSITFTISSDDISISSEGVLTFNTAPDYETKSSYTATVTASDGTNSTTQDITVNINDVREQTIQVSVEANNNGSGNVYVINGTQRPNLALVKGVTYTFVHPTAHPFRFSTTADGTHGGGSEFSTGVNTSSSGITVIKISDNTPEDLYYYCSIHAGMGNGIKRRDTDPETDPPAFPSFTVSSSLVDIATSEATVTLSLTVTDASGIDMSQYPSTFLGKAGSANIEGTRFVRVSGDDKNGTYESTVTIPTSASPGDYYLWGGYWDDVWGNTAAASTSTSPGGQNDGGITIENKVNNSPVITSSEIFSADENQTSIGTVTASDADGDSITFSISESEININSSTGVLTFASAPDYETKTSYTATVTASDGTNSATQDITVNITNVNDNSPTFSSNATFSAAENQTAIGTVVASDADGDGIAYSISGSDITINASSGVIAFVSAPDYETKTSYTATVTASDGTNSATQDITVNITNVNEAPTFTSDTTFSADENQTAIGTVTASDADGDDITFTVSGSDLEITSTGVLTFASAPDYETKTSYTATVTASDGTNSATQDITVNITNVNDNSPTFSSNATFSAAENQTAIGTVVASDADGDGIAYSISGSDITINASSGVIAFVSAPDYETKTSYTATVTASDGTNSATQDITVNIQNIPSVSGVAYASRYSVMDSDIPNTEYLADSNNDFTDTAQALISPSVVTGHVGGDDGIDIFSVSTTSSMYVNLDVIDYEDDVKELRVNIYESDGTLRETSYTSASEEYNMTILLPSSGNYFIVVDDLYGSSNYILTLAQRYNSSAYETSTDFIPDYISNEFIGYTPDKTIDSENKNNFSEDELKQIEAKKLELFNLTGEIFDQPGVKKFNMKSIKDHQSNLYDVMDNNNAFGREPSGLAPLTEKQLNYFNHWSYLQKLRKLSSGTIFDFNYRFETTNFSRDPEYSKQWNLERVQLEPVLNSLGQDVKDIAVAVIDSGGPTPGSTAWNESNLIDGGYDFVYGNSNSIDYLATSSYTGQDISHGTHVSTTIAAKNNGTGINGYAIKALNINVFNVNGTGSEAETGGADQTDVINAIRYAAGLSNPSGSVAPSSTPIKVINISISNRYRTLYPTAYCAAVQNAVDQGITVVAAAGNQQDVIPGLVSYPASCVGAISVGATNSAGNISYYSQQNASVDISAPGGGITDLDGDGNLDLILAYGNNSELKQTAGTSMASPQVAAAIALMYSVDNTLTPARVDSMLANGELTDDKGVSGRDDVYGYGELNLVKAIRNIQEDAGVSASFGYSSTSFLEFGSETTQLTVDLVKVGSSSLSFSSITSPNGTGLTYNQTSVDAEGFGTYTLFIDRSSIPNGEYSTIINFVLSDGSKVAVRVYYNVGSLRSRPNIGKVYIGMYNDSDDSLWGYGELEVDGSVSFVANDVSPGNYYIVTSTDINDNNSLCEYGELCEYYPRLSETATYFTVEDSNVSGYEIYLSPRYRYGGPNAASLSSNSQLSKINRNIEKEKNIKGIEKISINPSPTLLPDNPIEKGNNLVVAE